MINKYIIIWNLKYNFYLKYNSYLKICTINQFLFFLFFFCFVVKNRNTSKRRRKAINIFNKWRGLSWHDFLLFWNNLKAMHQSISLLMLSHSFNVFQNIGKKKKKKRKKKVEGSLSHLGPTCNRLLAASVYWHGLYKISDLSLLGFVRRML